MLKLQRRRRPPSGFTLIELLVVIAIIAILAAILFPVFAQARERARMTSCASQMKQLGLAVMQYSQDYDESFPYGTDEGGNGSWGQGWAGRIYPYVKAQAMYKCPDDSTKATAPAVPISYLWNINLMYTGANGGPGTAISGLASPARQVLLSEGVGATADVTNPAEAGSLAGNGTTNTWPNGSKFATGVMGNRAGATGGIARHSGNSGANYLLADGHVKFFQAPRVSSGWNPVNITDAQDTASADAGVNGVHAEGTSSNVYSITMSGK